LQRLREEDPIFSLHTVQEASCPMPFTRDASHQQLFRIAILDCGMKENILRILTDLGCSCVVFRSSVHASKIIDGGFDGLFVSNGPGDPQHAFNAINVVRQLLGKVPIFGICLGHQILALACNARTYKLPFGHHGINHPIKDLRTGKVEITSQNHNYAIDPQSLHPDIEVTHRNLNDGTVAGIRHRQLAAFSCSITQNPHLDRTILANLFQEFLELDAGTQDGSQIIETSSENRAVQVRILGDTAQKTLRADDVVSLQPSRHSDCDA